MEQQEPAVENGENRPDTEGSHQAALLIDFDNVTMGIRSNLGQELRNLLKSDVIRGNVAVQRAYADWRRYPQYIVPLSEASIDLIFAPAYGSSKKNATDIRLAIDALELVFTRPEIKTYILMSGDSDFSSLVLKLKEYGKYVIGVGIQESSSDLLVQNCDEYYSYSALAGLTKAGSEPLERHDPWVLVEKSIKKMVERNDTMRSDRLKQVMIEIDPSFSEKEQGFNKFNRFVVEAASRGLLSIQKMENGQYAVAPGNKVRSGAAEPPPPPPPPPPPSLGDSKAAEPKAKAEERKGGSGSGSGGGGRRGRRAPAKEEKPGPQPRHETHRARRKLTMDLALELLGQALDSLTDESGSSVRDSDVKRKLLQLDESFDEGEIGFNKFSKFLFEAEERGVIKLTRRPNGNIFVARDSRKSKREKSQPRERRPERVAKAPVGEAQESRSESTMKKLARFFFGAGEGEPEPSAKRPSEKPQARARQADRPPSPPPPPRPRGSERTRPAEGRAASGERESKGGQERGRQRSGRERPVGAARSREKSGRQDEGRGRGERQGQGQGQGQGPTSTRKRTAAAATGVGAGAGAGAGAGERAKTEVGEPNAEAPKLQPAAEASKPQQPSGKPRGMIRGRGGSRGRSRPAETRPPVLEGQGWRPKQGERSLEGNGQAKRREIISQLTKRYSGIGAKTAETLVKAFGADVYRVLDDEPERVREVLPEGRASRILEARREELKAGGE